MGKIFRKSRISDFFSRNLKEGVQKLDHEFQINKYGTKTTRISVLAVKKRCEFLDLPNFLAPAAPADVVLFLPSETSEAAEFVLPTEGLGLGIRLGTLCCNKKFSSNQWVKN